LARGAHRLSDRALGRAQVHRAARSLVNSFVHLAVIAAGIVVALGVLNLDKALASVLAGAGVVGLALGFAFQDLAANIISGVGLAVNRELPFKIDDIVETNGIFGTVREINLRTSLLTTLDGKQVVIPNKQIYQDKVTNWSTNAQLRVDVPCGVSYGDDLDQVEEIARRALEAVGVRDTSRDVEIYFEEFGSSSVNFIGRFWIRYERHADYLKARSEAVRRIRRAFDEHGITIPFPIRTLDFGIHGGKQLGQVLHETPLRLVDDDASSDARASQKRDDAQR
jgi:small conductance mechanosensitive channel